MLAGILRAEGPLAADDSSIAGKDMALQMRREGG